MTDPITLDTTYLHLDDGLATRPLPVDERFWETIDQRADLERGRLVTEFTMTEDWESWEVHPAGDEVVYLLSGSADLILEIGEGEHRPVELRDRGAVVVPAGTWHTADVHRPSQVLHITPGQGTRHRPR